MKYYIYFGLCVLLSGRLAHSHVLEVDTIRTNLVCADDNSLVVVSGAQIPAVSGRKIKQLSLLTYSHSQQALDKIVFQIDQKDAQGRYILSTKDSDNSINTFADNDELVFRKKDLGRRIERSSELLTHYTLIELEVIIDSAAAESANESRWLYIDVHSENSESDLENNKQLIYEQDNDVVSSSVYKTGFSKTHPFLLNNFHWRLPDQSGWGADITDMMKIRHLGRFFGLPFKRTQDDYSSQLIDVKQGPLRIIRRTENRIKVFWKLKSPALFIDYIMMPDGFVMDTMIDIPFNISFFFSDLQTITTMDWNHSAAKSDLRIQAAKEYPAMLINGLPSENKTAFNQIMGNTFSLASLRGNFNVTLDIPDDFPIQSNLYLRDSIDEIDSPENVPGQFGNIGFKTTGWENIENKLYHLKFTVCVTAVK